MTVQDIIRNDKTLSFFITEADIDWFNNWQVGLRLTALKLALFDWIDKQVDCACAA